MQPDDARMQPCPFCGDERPRIYLASVHPNEWVGRCDNCVALGPVHDTEAAALAAWNVRVTDEVVRLRALVDDLWDYCEHGRMCDVHLSPGAECTCGLRALGDAVDYRTP